MARRIPGFILFVSFFSNAFADAGPALCAASYLGGIAPKISNVKIGGKSQEICYSGYAVHFSGITRTPLWSAEHLTVGRVSAACVMHRHGPSHTDPYLAESFGSELADYADSGYDSGQMAPAADMPDRESQAESFSLANMAPQLHANKAGIWEELENGVRNLVLSGHDVYVVSGPLFEGADIKQLNDSVMVPTAFFKAVYDATAR
jgi:endonuclease G